MSWQQSNDFGNFTCNISLQLELNALYKPLSTTAVHHQMQRCSGNSRNSKVSETNGIWSHQPLHRIMLVVLETQHDQSKDHQNFQRQLGLKVRTNLSPWSPQSQRHHLDTSWRKSFLNFCYAYRLTLCMLLEGFHISNSVLLPGYCRRNHLISIVEPMHPAAKSPASDSRFTGIPAFWWSIGSILALWAIQKFMYWGACIVQTWAALWLPPRRGGVPTTGQSNCPRSGGPENFLDADAATGNMVVFCMILFPEVCIRKAKFT